MLPKRHPRFFEQVFSGLAKVHRRVKLQTQRELIFGSPLLGGWIWRPSQGLDWLRGQVDGLVKIQFNEIDNRCNGEERFPRTVFATAARIFGTIGLRG